MMTRRRLFGLVVGALAGTGTYLRRLEARRRKDEALRQLAAACWARAEVGMMAYIAEDIRHAQRELLQMPGWHLEDDEVCRGEFIPPDLYKVIR